MCNQTDLCGFFNRSRLSSQCLPNGMTSLLCLHGMFNIVGHNALYLLYTIMDAGTKKILVSCMVKVCTIYMHLRNPENAACYLQHACIKCKYHQIKVPSTYLKVLDLHIFPSIFCILLSTTR